MINLENKYYKKSPKLLFDSSIQANKNLPRLVILTSYIHKQKKLNKRAHCTYLICQKVTQKVNSLQVKSKTIHKTIIFEQFNNKKTPRN